LGNTGQEVYAVFSYWQQFSFEMVFTPVLPFIKPLKRNPTSTVEQACRRDKLLNISHQ
jgi:hypothetical protein